MADKVYKTLVFGYKRVDNAPLEANTLYNSIEDAEYYAKNNPTAYAGQQIAVTNGSEANLYIIKPDRSLSMIGGSDTDGTVPFVAEFNFDYTHAGTEGVVAATIPAGRFIEDMIVIIDEAFAPDAVVSVGTVSNPNKYYPHDELYPQETSVPAAFEKDVNITPDMTESIRLYIKTDETIGKGKLKVSVW